MRWVNSGTLLQEDTGVYPISTRAGAAVMGHVPWSPDLPGKPTDMSGWMLLFQLGEELKEAQGAQLLLPCHTCVTLYSTNTET